MAMEIEEIVKIIISITVLVILVGAVFFLFSEKGGELLSSIKDAIKFGA